MPHSTASCAAPESAQCDFSHGLLDFRSAPRWRAYHQWRKDPSRELSIALVADERFGRATGRIEAS